MYLITKGSTDRSIDIQIIDSAAGTPETGVTATTAGIDLWYAREGAAHTSLTTWTALSGTVSTAETTTLTGVDTAFTTELTAGDEILVGSGATAERRIIDAIATATSLTVTVAFATTQTGVAVSDLDANDLASETATHADNHLIHRSDGVYRIDLPDAAVATGVNTVKVGGTITGMIVVPETIVLTGVDLTDGVRAGLTALPNAAADAAGGLPISDAGGLDLDAQIGTDIDAILEDTGTTLPAAITALNDPTAQAIVDELMAETIDGSVSYKTVFQAIASVLAGKVSGGGTTTITFRDLADTVNRVAATVDSSGNRSAVVITADT